jgi:signal transduction histidine kinase
MKNVTKNLTPGQRAELQSQNSKARILLVLVSINFMSSVSLRIWLEFSRQADQYLVYLPVLNFSLLFGLVTIYFCVKKNPNLAAMIFALTSYVQLIAAHLVSVDDSLIQIILGFLIVPPVIVSFVSSPVLTIAVSFVGAVISCWVAISHVNFSEPFTYSMFSRNMIIYLGLAAGSFIKRRDDAQLEIVQASVESKQRFAMLGQMAGRIAHEFNNPIAVIRLRASQAKRKLKQSPNTQDALLLIDEINKASDDISKMVETMLLFVEAKDGDHNKIFEVTELVHIAEQFCADDFVADRVRLKISMPSEKVYAYENFEKSTKALVHILQCARASVAGLAESSVDLHIAFEQNKVRFIVSSHGTSTANDFKNKIVQQLRFATSKNEKVVFTYNFDEISSSSLNPNSTLVFELPRGENEQAIA